MLTNYIIAIQYTRGSLLCNYPSEGHDHAHVSNVRAILKLTNDQLILHNIYMVSITD